MVMIKMAPTDTTTLHTEHSHADHIMTDGLSVSQRIYRLTSLIICATLSLSALKSSTLVSPAPPDLQVCVCLCVSECVQGQTIVKHLFSKTGDKHNLDMQI